jgi:hypothetical protein
MNLDEVTEDQSVLEDGDVAIIEPGPEVSETGPTKPRADDCTSFLPPSYHTRAIYSLLECRGNVCVAFS